MRRANLQSRLAALEAGAPGQAHAEATPEQQAQIQEVIAWMRTPEQERGPVKAELEETLSLMLEIQESF